MKLTTNLKFAILASLSTVLSCHSLQAMGFGESLIDKAKKTLPNSIERPSILVPEKITESIKSVTGLAPTLTPITEITKEGKAVGQGGSSLTNTVPNPLSSGLDILKEKVTLPSVDALKNNPLSEKLNEASQSLPLPKEITGLADIPLSLNNLLQVVNSLTTRIGELESKISDKLNPITGLSDQFKGIQSKITDLEALKTLPKEFAGFTEKLSVVNTLSQGINSFGTQMTALEGKLSPLDKLNSITGLSDQLSGIQGKLNNLDSLDFIRTLPEQLQTLQNGLTTLKDIPNEFAGLKDMLSSVNTLSQGINSLGAQMSALEDKLSPLDKLNSITGLSDQLNGIQGKLNNLDSLDFVRTLPEQLQTLQSGLSMLNNVFARIDGLESKLAGLNNLDFLTKLSEQLNNVQGQFGLLENIKDLPTQVGDIQSKLSILESVQKFPEQLNNLQSIFSLAK